MSELPDFKFCLLPEVTGDKRFLPTRAEPTATGWDVRACLPEGPLTMRPSQTALISMGFRVFCAPGWWFEIRPRSSSFAKKNLASLYGVVDESYGGVVRFACQFMPDLGAVPGFGLTTAFDHSRRTIEHGEALGQLIPVRRQEMIVSEVDTATYESLCKTRGAERGAGGFGSTGG